jgi:hypothetical protein
LEKLIPIAAAPSPCNTARRPADLAGVSAELSARGNASALSAQGSISSSFPQPVPWLCFHGTISVPRALERDKCDRSRVHFGTNSFCILKGQPCNQPQLSRFPLRR